MNADKKRTNLMFFKNLRLSVSIIAQMPFNFVRSSKNLQPLPVFLALLVCFAGPSLASADGDKNTLTVDDISQKVEAAQAQVKDVQMDLNMEMKDALSGQTQQVVGSVKMKSPNLIYVHYTKPTEQFLYVDADLVRMYQPAQHMVYRQKSQDPGAGPVYLGVGKELKRYIDISHVSIVENSGDKVVLLFIPKSDDAAFTRMRVSIRKKDWWPVQMEVETPALTTTAKFSNLAFNQGVDAALFQFTEPKDAQTVDGTVF